MEYYDFNSWRRAGRPHDKPFLIVRERIMERMNVSESTISSIVESLCVLVVWNLDHHCAETKGAGYRIEPVPLEPVPPVLHNTWSFDYKDFTFSVYTEPSLYPGPSRVRLSVGAIATILSNK